jgi:demethylmenaquinone methyltransferase/2-methoxy-6-polyprenyl-1,4-benzoquinol methylase
MSSEFHASQPETIRKMFSAISSRYDVANTVLSMGTHHNWKRAVVRWSGIEATQKVLDCATGTGDLAFEFEKVVGRYGEVIATDFCEDMLQFGIKKAKARHSKVQFQTADVMQLPFEANRFDLSSIAFGIRNVANPAQGLSEMARVTKPGGTVIVLEFGQPKNLLWGSLYQLYSEQILPRIGGVLTGKRDAYDYLQSSSAKFPSGEKFINLARATGQFDEFRTKPLMGGIAYIYKFRRRSDS